MSARRARGARAALFVALALACPGTRAHAGGLAIYPSPAPAPAPAPYHRVGDWLVFGGDGELRFGYDRVRGVGNPDWASVPRVAAFAVAQVHPRARLVGEVAYDHVADVLQVERALAEWDLHPGLTARAGIFLPPLGRANREHAAPVGEFTARSLVMTEIVGVPFSQLGAGIERRAQSGQRALGWEVDLVTGYDEGVITDGPGGTRLPKGRNTGYDHDNLPSLTGRIAIEPGPHTEFALSGLAGTYNQTRVEGITVDHERMLALAIGEARGEFLGMKLSSEAAFVQVDVPPDLRGLYAQRQCGASGEASRVLLSPALPGGGASSLSAALRADAVDFDTMIAGDSESRLSAALNLRRAPRAVFRFDWYYQVTRDRFDNPKPAAGVSFTTATYF